MRAMKLLTGGLMLVGLLGGGGFMGLLQAQTASKSRLSQLVIQPATQVFRPFQLVIGQPARFGLRGTPGTPITLIYGPYSGASTGWPLALGTVTPQTLPAGSQMQTVILPASGTTELVLEVPNTPELVGKAYAVEAITTTLPTWGDARRVQQLSADGRPATTLALPVVSPVELSKRPAFYPSFPGLDPNLARQIGTISEVAQTTDERRKELLNNSGEINRNNTLDRNRTLLNNQLQPNPLLGY